MAIIIRVYINIYGTFNKMCSPICIVRTCRRQTAQNLSGVLAAALLVFAAQSACAQWESIRRVGAASCLIENSTNGYLTSYTVGEPSASRIDLEDSSSSVISGYLSQIPSRLFDLSFRVLSFESTGTVVSEEGALLGAGTGNIVKFVFSNEVSTEAVTAGVVVSEVLDHLGEPVNSTQIVSVSPVPDETAVFLNSAADWKKGSLYSIRYSSAVTDINGVTLLPDNTRYFTVKMDYQQNNVAVALSDFRTRVTIPSGAYSSDFYTKVSTAQTSVTVEAANRKLAGIPGASAQALSILKASAFGAAGGAVQPSSPCVISLPYADHNGDGIVDASFPPAKVKNLAVWRLDEINSLWVKQVGASLDESAGVASLKVANFDSYALMAVPDTDVSLVRAYPVPFSPNAGNSARYGDWTRLITFTDLPAYGKIRIYTISGDLVRELEVVPSEPVMKWDVRNSAGEIVGSGVYIWEIVCGKNRKTGKLIVIK